MHVTHRSSCRACGSGALTQVIDLGEQHIQGVFVKEGMDPPPIRKLPLTLLRCDPTRDEQACGLLQLSCTVPPEILYSTYWYRSGTNQTMRDHLAGIVHEAVEMLQAGPRRVLDVGCNDGTLLSCYPAAYERFGVDPSDAIDTIGHDITVIKDRFPSSAVAQVAADRPFDVITSIAMFYDLEDPVGFVRSVERNLSPEGFWIFEVSYMPAMLEMRSYDTICHEHLEYYSLAAIEFILRQGGMKLFRVEMNDMNGGSIRCYATHEGNRQFFEPKWLAALEGLRRQEFDLALDTNKPYQDFQDEVNAHRDELVRLTRELKRAGKSIHVYGASTKGNTILQFCGLDNGNIDYAADRNPAKHGARTLGTDIPIISEEDSRAMRPDYYLVLPWHFRDEFLRRESQTLREGTQMIFPLPTVEIVGDP